MIQDLMRYRPELSRALHNFHYERAPTGVLFPRSGIFLGGVFTTRVNGAAEMVTPNVMLFAGLDDILKVYFKQSAARPAFYLVPFRLEVDPPQELTAATFGATMGEFVEYSETTRPVWTAGDVQDQGVSNTESPARFTSTATGGTVWGAALTTASAKNSASGLLVACGKFDTARVLTGTSDKLDIEYAFVGQDGGPTP